MINKCSGISRENLWQVIADNQGKTIYTVKKLPFTYQVKGGELFTERKKKSITRATFEKLMKSWKKFRKARSAGQRPWDALARPISGRSFWRWEW